MAILHGRAGQYPKGKATQYHRRLIVSIYSCAMFGMMALGFAAGYTWYKWGPYLCLVAFFIAVAGWYVLWRRVDPYADKMAKERIKHLRGAQAEALVAWLLKDLEDDWHVFNGIKLERDSDIDHVVVGPGGVFCISTKSQRGIFAGTRDGMLHNGQPCDFAQQAMRQTMDLKDRMTIAMGRDVPWIQPLLAVPFGFTEADACDGKVWLVHQENITDRIAPEKAAKKLDKQQIARAVKVLEMIGTDAADVYKRPPTAS